jgi:hypothetical protein
VSHTTYERCNRVDLVVAQWSGLQGGGFGVRSMREGSGV